MMNQNKLKGSREVASKEYYMGLDIGTNSVGWAVTNPNYEVLKFHSRRMWGSRLFDAGIAAVERRTKRSARRRNHRRHWRLSLLEDLFAEEMAKVDMGFFMRLKESAYHYEDKSDGAKAHHLLFIDKDYSDADYFKEYPTIYHLRDELVKKGTTDIRKLFLGIHHIVKYRGHFVYEGQEFSAADNLADTLHQLLVALPFTSDVFRGESSVDAEKQILSILQEKGLNKSDKNNAIKELKLTGKEDEKRLKSLVTLVLGGSCNLMELLGTDETLELEAEVKKIDLSKVEVYEETRTSYAEAWGSDVSIIDLGKSLYDALLLGQIKEAGKMISASKVDSYKVHQEDLGALKKVLRDHSKELYDDMFNADEKKGANYLKYTGHGKVDNTSCTQELFYKYVKKVLENLEETEVTREILNKIELCTFMPLQRVKDNGVIPYQIHKEELVAILEKAKGNFPFLSEVSDGISTAEKIIKLFEFRVPYFVGPLNTYHSTEKGGFAWAKRKAAGKILPWNFEEKIDLPGSAEAFIKNLTNKCTYLMGEDVLPKSSLDYSEFMLLNELNNLRYEGKPLSMDAKDFLMKEVFSKEHKKMTARRLVDKLHVNGYIDQKGELTGLNGDIKADLASYRDMLRILGEGFDRQMAEHIILQITLFGESKKMLKQTLEDHYGAVLSEDQIKDLCRLRYRDWGRLSARFLRGIHGCVVGGDGESMTILEALYKTSDNLMQLLSSSYTFMDVVMDDKDQELAKTSDNPYDMLESMYVSPAVKRSVWQAIRIIDEVSSIRKGAPSRIFVEVTRTNKEEKGKQKSSRKEKIQALYKSIQKESPEWKDKLTEIEGTESNRFNSKKLFLYYMQQGRCMYSGDSISLDELFTATYDIDHIYPRSLTKDDSFDNLVLCKKEINAHKTNEYPIEGDIRHRQKAWWKSLLDTGFISERKYNRLTRNDDLTPDELNHFIARQIVETNQSVKATIDILRQLYPNTEVVFSKAENVSDFRHDNAFVKVRSLNHHHHAKDAYLNVVVGNVYHERFTRHSAIRGYKVGSSPLGKERKTYTCDMRDYVEQTGMVRSYNLTKIFDKIVTKADNKEVEVWNKDTHMPIVEKMINSNDVRVTRKASEQKGALSDETIYKAKDSKPESYLGIKNGNNPLSDVTKYGGVTKVKGAYYTIIEYTGLVGRGKAKKRMTVKELFNVPFYLLPKLQDKAALIDYIAEKKGVERESIKIIYDKLPQGSKVKLDGFYYYVTGRTNDYICIDGAVEITLNNEAIEYLKVLEKFMNISKENKLLKAEVITTTNQRDNKIISITKEKNETFFLELVNKMKSPIFTKMQKNKVKDLEDVGFVNFKELSLEEQCKQLFEILNMLTNMKTDYDVKALKITMSRSLMNSQLTKVKEFIIINESITGLFVSEVKII